MEINGMEIKKVKLRKRMVANVDYLLSCYHGNKHGQKGKGMQRLKEDMERINIDYVPVKSSFSRFLSVKKARIILENKKELRTIVDIDENKLIYPTYSIPRSYKHLPFVAFTAKGLDIDHIFLYQGEINEKELENFILSMENVFTDVSVKVLNNSYEIRTFDSFYFSLWN
jgi:hypothetical protein